MDCGPNDNLMFEVFVVFLVCLMYLVLLGPRWSLLMLPKAGKGLSILGHQVSLHRGRESQVHAVRGFPVQAPVVMVPAGEMQSIS